MNEIFWRSFAMNSYESSETAGDDGEMKEEDCSCFTLVSFDPDDDIITDVLEKTDPEKPVDNNRQSHSQTRHESEFLQTPTFSESNDSNIG